MATIGIRTLQKVQVPSKKLLNSTSRMSTRMVSLLFKFLSHMWITERVDSPLFDHHRIFGAFDQLILDEHLDTNECIPDSVLPTS